MTLTDWRTQNNKMSMAVLAERLNVSQPTISRIEAGKQWPDRDLLQKIFDLTDGQVTPNDFVLFGVPLQGEEGATAQ